MDRIIFDVNVGASPDVIAKALDSQEGIATWWTDDVEFDGGVGSTLDLGFAPAAPARFKLRVDAASPELVQWTSVGEIPDHWLNTTISWTLTPDPDGSSTKVRFLHDGFADGDEGLPSTAYTWGQLLGVLKTYAETGTATPLFNRS